MYQLAKEIVVTFILIFVFAAFTVLGWNSFAVECFNAEVITYGSAVGLWLLFFTGACALTVVRIVFSRGGEINVHNHYQIKQGEEDGE